MLVSNEPIKVADLQKLPNQLMLNGAFAIEMVNNSFSKSNTNFYKAWSKASSVQIIIITIIIKYIDMSSENYILLYFTK